MPPRWSGEEHVKIRGVGNKPPRWFAIKIMIEIRAICRRDFPHDVVAVHLRRASPIVPGFIVTAECHKLDGRGRAS